MDRVRTWFGSILKARLQSYTYAPTCRGSDYQRRNSFYTLLNTKKQTQQATHEIHAHLDRTFARLSHGIRECPEAHSGGFHSMEGSGQLQNRTVRHPSG